MWCTYHTAISFKREIHQLSHIYSAYNMRVHEMGEWSFWLHSLLLTISQFAYQIFQRDLSSCKHNLLQMVRSEYYISYSKKFPDTRQRNYASKPISTILLLKPIDLQIHNFCPSNETTWWKILKTATQFYL